MKMAQLVKMGVLKSKVSKVNRKMTLEQISLNFCFYIALNRISSNLSEWIIHEWIFGIAMLKPIFKAIPLYVRICFFLRSASPIIFFAIWIHWAKKKKSIRNSFKVERIIEINPNGLLFIVLLIHFVLTSSCIIVCFTLVLLTMGGIVLGTNNAFNILVSSKSVNRLKDDYSHRHRQIACGFVYISLDGYSRNTRIVLGS